MLSGDLLEQPSLIEAVEEEKLDEVYNLATQGFVQTSWSQPVLTSEFTAISVTKVLKTIRRATPKVRFYHHS